MLLKNLQICMNKHELLIFNKQAGEEEIKVSVNVGIIVLNKNSYSPMSGKRFITR